MDKTKCLDTKGACFLCGLVIKKVTRKGSREMKEVSLRNICRYLNINPGSLLRKNSQKEDNFEDCKMRTCDFSVTLCSTCSSITTYLSDLISQLTTIQILITNQLQVFHQIIRFPVDYHRPGNFRVNQSVTDGLVERLKQEATQKCATKVNSLITTYFPTVRLNKLRDEEVQGLLTKTKDKTPNCETPPASRPPKRRCVTTSTPLSSRTHDKPPLFSNLSPVLDNHQGDNGQSLSIPAPPPESKDTPPCFNNPTPLSQKEVIHDICSNYFTKTETGFQCSLCNLSLSKSVHHVQQHIINSHPETVFLQPFNSLSEQVFHDQCRQFFFEETNLAREPHQSLAEGSSTQKFGRSRYKCEFCSRSLSDGRNFRLHLVTVHYSQVEEKLLKFCASANQKVQTETSEDGNIPSKKTPPAGGGSHGDIKLEMEMEDLENTFLLR